MVDFGHIFPAGKYHHFDNPFKQIRELHLSFIIV